MTFHRVTAVQSLFFEVQYSGFVEIAILDDDVIIKNEIFCSFKRHETKGLIDAFKEIINSFCVTFDKNKEL